jgi:hypothetical protein|tara:strand:+ start:706 stop:1410 length:705 start_codon:yes stop_codon:yes gene_type:complete
MNLFKQPWHFDKFRVDEDGEYVKCIGHFQGDWDADIIAARDVGVQTQPYNKQDYGHAANAKSKDHVEEDKENPDGKPEAVMFRKINFDKHPGVCPMFEKIVDYLHMNTEKKLTQKFNDQFPNDQLMWHIDNLPGNPRKERVIDNPDFKYQEPDKIRFLIMLEDWEPGQVIQFGNKIYTQWRKGFAICWEWSTLPHLTWNGSWKKRPALQITGSTTEKTIELIKQSNASTEHRIN